MNDYPENSIKAFVAIDMAAKEVSEAKTVIVTTQGKIVEVNPKDGFTAVYEDVSDYLNNAYHIFSASGIMEKYEGLAESIKQLRHKISFTVTDKTSVDAVRRFFESIVYYRDDKAIFFNELNRCLRILEKFKRS